MTNTSQATAIKHPEKGSRAAQLVAMLARKQGATLEDITKATAWKPHSARAALTGLRKRGYEIESNKPEGGSRNYRIEAA